MFPVNHCSCVCVETEIGEEYGDVRPLTTNLQKVLRTNYAKLVELIDTSKSGLVSELGRVGIITGQHWCHHCLYNHCIRRQNGMVLALRLKLNTVAARGCLPPAANVCVAAPANQIGSAVRVFFQDFGHGV